MAWKKIAILAAAVLTALVPMIPIQAEELPSAQEPVQAEVPLEESFQREEFECFRDGLKISGELLLPDQAAPMPLVICAHGYCGNRYDVSEYARVFAENGIAACIFDFIGGGPAIRSDGLTTEMSVLTQAQDLQVILDTMKADPRFNPEQIFLLGESQGGFVGTYVAEERPEDFAGLVLLYPAYEIPDEARALAPDPDHIPERVEDMGMEIGSVYLRDAMSVDIYANMGVIDQSVLIIYGTEDPIVPFPYIERALEILPGAELVLVDGGKHGFIGQTRLDVAQTAADFVWGLIIGQESGEPMTY